MASVFDDLDVGAYTPGRNLSPDQARKVLGLRTTGQFSDNPNVGGADFWERQGSEGNNNFRLYSLPTLAYTGTGDSQTPVERGSSDYITRVREDTGGRLADWWNPDGTYGGVFDVNSPSAELNTAIALMAGGYFGGNYLQGLQGAGAGATGGMSVAEQMAIMEANGMTAAEAAAAIGGQTAVDAGIGTLYTAAGTPIASNVATQGANPTWWDTAKNVYNGIDQFANSGVGKILGMGAALALSKDAEPAPNDPMLTKADERTTQIGDKAVDKANADDAYFRSVFLPRYLAAMDQASARDKELYDFNMQRARLAAGQMDKFYAEVDAYDGEGAQQRAAGKAVASARQANDANANMLRRRALSMGLNPNSGAWGAGAAHLASRAELNEIFAGNMAREAARKEGLNLRATAAGLRGADSGYANSAASGANLGLNALTTGQQGFNANSTINNSTLGLGLNAFSTLGGWGLSRTNSADSLSAANTAGWNGLLGYGLGRFMDRGTQPRG